MAIIKTHKTHTIKIMSITEAHIAFVYSLLRSKVELAENGLSKPWKQKLQIGAANKPNPQNVFRKIMLMCCRGFNGVVDKGQ